MATRIVLLGWGGDALELEPLDADLLVKDKICRVSFTRWGEPLANATVLVPHRNALGGARENSTEEQHKRVFARVRKLCPRAVSFKVRGPVEVGG